jgi:LL-diaminopimelate aminotransferase
MIAQSKRINSIKPYYFLNLQNKIEQLNAQGKEVIRLDIGSPDLPPPDVVIETLARVSKQPDAHGYMPTQGPDSYREAVADYYQQRFNVKLNPQTEINPLLGSKEGIINLHQIFIDPGDEVLLPDPGYPSYSFGAEYAGGIPVRYELDKNNGFAVNIDAIKKQISAKTKILWLNFPNNPTGSTINQTTMQNLVNLALEHRFLIVQDAPYTDVYFDDFQPPSILAIPGAKEVAVEINSLSKTFHMAGWRMGMICANAEVIKSIRTIKSKVDNSTSFPIFAAATAALHMNRAWIEERNLILKKRRDLLANYFQQISPEFSIPPAGYYLWAKIPQKFTSDVEFCEQALEKAGISITPGSIYGENGKGYIRITICQPEEIILSAIERLKNWYL